MEGVGNAMSQRATASRGRASRRLVGALLGSVALAAIPAATASAQLPSTTDPRAGLSPGVENAATASLGLTHLANRPKPTGLTNTNADIAFQGNYAFVGNYDGIAIYDISNPANPVLRTAVSCPGGQNDVSVWKNLLFVSVESTSRGRVDCSLDTTKTLFRGIRVFDISNLSAPQQVAALQTCRGSHTHTLVRPKSDANNVYIYNSGTATVRAGTELAGCDANNTNTPAGENPSKWKIDIIKVPVAAPQDAAIVGGPRLFANEAGAVNGLQNAPQAPNHPCTAVTPDVAGGGCATGAAPPNGNWSPQPITDACHDITVYEALDLAAGACEGNGILIDISDPANPKRIDAVADPLFSYWHGATFSNDGKAVVFTDEWGGGSGARCRATDQLSWGANAIYEIVDRKMVFKSYYKLPVAQTVNENCVSHVGNLIPVQNRNILVQAWYQGGVSVMDFTNLSAPKEVAYFDRGPVSGASLVFGGFWSTYWYNGVTYGSELHRNFDVMGLTPTAEVSANEIAAAREVEWDRLNVQSQQEITWEPSFNVVRAYRDQLEREGNIDAKTLARVDMFIDRAEGFEDRGKSSAASAQLHALSRQLGKNADFDELRGGLNDLSDAL